MVAGKGHQGINFRIEKKYSESKRNFRIEKKIFRMVRGLDMPGVRHSR